MRLEWSNDDLIMQLSHIREIVLPFAKTGGTVGFDDDCEPIFIHALGRIAGIVTNALGAAAVKDHRMPPPPAPKPGIDSG